MSSMPRKPAQIWAISRIRVQGRGEKKAYKIEDSHPGSLECGDKSPLSIGATCRTGLREAQPMGQRLKSVSRPHIQNATKPNFPDLLLPETLRRGFQSKFDTNFVLHYNSVMKNMTITLDEEVARWARIRAAEKDTSVSRLVGEMLREKMRNEAVYQSAMQQYLTQRPKKLKKPGTRYPRREELHER
jgi:plasmid stability protein